MFDKMVGTVAAVALTLALQGEPLRFYDVVPYSPGEEATVVSDILRTHRETGLDTFLYSVSLDPRGRPAKANVDAAVASYRKIREGVKDSGVRLGFLLQSILGHWKRADREIEPWQRSIDVDGNPLRFCVLDERYRAYIRDVAASLAAEKPCFILGDDDIRAYSSGKLECFCPLHTAEFNRRTGRSFTPEQYRAAVKSAVAGDEIATACAQLRDEIPVSVSRTIREGIDSVDASIPSGSCMPGVATERMVPRVKAMCAGHPTVMRFANGHYAEFGRDVIIFLALRTQLFKAFYQDKIDAVLDEADTFPHTTYSRGGRSYHAKLAMSVFLGLDGAKLWYVGMHKRGERIPESLDGVFARYMPFYRALHEQVRGARTLGVRIPARLSPVAHPLRPMDGGFAADDRWVQNCMGVFGIPFQADFSVAPGEVVLVESEKTVNAFSSDELDSLLSGRVLATGPAVSALAARGREPDLGCGPVKGDLTYNVERIVRGGRRPPISKEASVCPLGNLASGAEKVSELCFSLAGAAGSEVEPVAAGSVLYANSRGGKVFSSAFTVPNLRGFNDQNPCRKAWLADALRRLNRDFPPISENTEPNLTLARETPDESVLVFTLNLSYDDIEELRYSCQRGIADAEVLSPEGAWRPLRVTRTGGRVTLDHRLSCFECAVLRFHLR